MNGRVYDPATAVFMSPDPFVQAPGNWLNFNRYGYCMNNPTKYTDPSGYKLADKNSVWFADGYQKWMGYSGGGGGSSDGGMGQNMWNSYVSVRQDGWTGTYSDFSVEYDKNPDSKGGHWVAETVTNYGYTESKGNTYFWSQTNTEVRYVSNGSQNDYPTTDYLSNLSSGAGIAVSIGQELKYPATIAYITLQGTKAVVTSDQILKSLKIASKGVLYGGIIIDIALATSGDQDSQKYLLLNTSVNIVCFMIGGPAGLVLGIGYLVLKDQGTFKEFVTPQYFQNTYTPNTITPQDAIKSQYQLKDGIQPIYINH